MLRFACVRVAPLLAGADQGRPVCAYVRRGLGFDETNVDELEQGLLAIAQSEDVEDSVPSAHGTKYVIEGALQTPAGRLVQVRTV